MLSRGGHSTIFWDVPNKQHANSRCHVHPQRMARVTKKLGKFVTQRKRYRFLYNWKEKEAVKSKNLPIHLFFTCICYNRATKCICITSWSIFLDFFHLTPFLLRIYLLINNYKYLLPLHGSEIIMHLIKHLQLVKLVRLARCLFLSTMIHPLASISSQNLCESWIECSYTCVKVSWNEITFGNNFFHPNLSFVCIIGKHINGCKTNYPLMIWPLNKLSQ